MQTIQPHNVRSHVSGHHPEGLRPLYISPSGALQMIRRQSVSLPADMLPLEFSRNASQACEAAGGGEVEWVVARDRKYWSLVDTGCGMTAEDMQEYLTSAYKSANPDGRFGVGAKMSACRASPSGVTWTSLHDGEASRVMIVAVDGIPHATPVTGVDLQSVHGKVVAAGHGTSVEFSDPLEISQPKMIALLSARWWSSPPGVRVFVTCRGGRGEGQDLRYEVVPLSVALGGCANLGSVTVGDGVVATAWLLPEDGSGLTCSALTMSPTTRWEPTCGVGLFLRGENYDGVRAGDAQRRLQKFGIWHGAKRVWITLHADPAKWAPNNERTTLCRIGAEENAGVPWDEWGDAFEQNHPLGLAEYLDGCSVSSPAEELAEVLAFLAEEAFDSAGHGRGPKQAQPGGSGAGSGAGSSGARPPGPARAPGKFAPAGYEWSRQGPDFDAATWDRRRKYLVLNEDSERLGWLRGQIEATLAKKGSKAKQLVDSLARRVFLTLCVDVVGQRHADGGGSPEGEDFYRALGHRVSARAVTLRWYDRRRKR